MHHPDEQMRDFIQMFAAEIGREPTEDEVYDFIMGDNKQRAEILRRAKS